MISYVRFIVYHSYWLSSLSHYIICVWRKKNIELIFINIFHKYSLGMLFFLCLCGFFSQSLRSDQPKTWFTLVIYLIYRFSSLFHTLNETLYFLYSCSKLIFHLKRANKCLFAINNIVTLEIFLLIFSSSQIHPSIHSTHIFELLKQPCECHVIFWLTKLWANSMKMMTLLK